VPLCVFKHAVSQFQFYKLMRYPHLKEICLMFDHDAIKESWKDAERLTNQFTVTVAEMPAGENNKKLDPNDDVEAAIVAFDSRQAFKKNGAIAQKVSMAMQAAGGRGVLDMTTLTFD